LKFSGIKKQTDFPAFMSVCGKRQREYSSPRKISKDPVPLQQLDYSLPFVKKQERQADPGRAPEQESFWKNISFFVGTGETGPKHSVFCIKKHAYELIFY
jgi:hypothetical protein